MNECKYCGIECETAYCCPSHKAMWFKRKRVTPETDRVVTPEVVTPKSSVTPAKVTPEPVTPVTPVTPSVTPQWQLKPGDDGYNGVCIEIDGQWIVRPEPEPTGIPHVLKRSDLGTFRGSRPYYLDQDTGLSHLSDEQLHRRLSDLKSWQSSPEYAERVYRLQHGLTSHSIPANMVTA